MKTCQLKFSFKSSLNPIYRKTDVSIDNTKTMEIADLPKIYSELKSPTDKTITEIMNFCLLLDKILETKPIIFLILPLPFVLVRFAIKLLKICVNFLNVVQRFQGIYEMIYFSKLIFIFNLNSCDWLSDQLCLYNFY